MKVERPYTRLILEFVKQNEGCTVTQVMQHLGIQAGWLLDLRPIGPGLEPHLKKHIASGDIRWLVANDFMKTDQSRKPTRVWGLRIKDSSRLYITPKGEDLLRNSSLSKES